MTRADKIRETVSTRKERLEKINEAANRVRAWVASQVGGTSQSFSEQMPTGKTRPSIPQYPALSATLGKYLEAALYGKYSSQQALDMAAAEVNELLK